MGPSRNDDTFSANQLFDRTTGQFRQYDPKRRLTLLDQFMIANAIKTLDGDRIRELWTRLRIWPAADMSSLLFWGTVHAIRIGLVNATEAEKRESEDWLKRNGLDVPICVSQLAKDQLRQRV